ncbi:MAG TPA: prolyl oligopeptidase family serine peptidase [Candidatus Limnocylindrales bacterium]|nr:prolyl oligopeptidase family serine peptidase [Candidatus Limnocylindrales bacterium]
MAGPLMAGEASAPATGGSGLTIEAIVAVDPPKEFRMHPRERVVAFTAEAAGTRQLFTLSLRGPAAAARQITASELPVSDPQWSPDGRRLAYVRDDEIWIVEADGSRLTRVVAKPGGGRDPRWSPDGRRLAFLSRRRGWSQVWLVDAPVPRRGRPQRQPRAPIATALTRPGFDVDAVAWSPDGSRLAVTGQQAPDDLTTWQIAIVDVASGASEIVAGTTSHDTGASWLPDGSLVFVSDADGWFQVVRRSADGRDRIVLTDGKREHGEPSGGYGYVPIPSPNGERVVHIEVRDGLIDLFVRDLGDGSPPKRGRGRPPKTPRTVSAATVATRISPWDGVWRAIGWLSDGAWIAAIGESETRPQDLWLLPTPGVAPEGSRPRQITDSQPAVLAAAMRAGGLPAGERVTITARDGMQLEGTLWRPSAATGKRGGRRVPTIVHPHGGPTAQWFRSFQPFNLALAEAGYAVLDIDFRGSTGYGRTFRHANHGEWGHADVHDVIDAAHWAAEQPWSDGRLTVYGGSYGGYLVLCALVDEPSLWSAGVDLYGDSEIAESFRHGDRPGRLDLLKMMGTPDDPDRSDAYRRGSPVYRAERIEAPLLILHGRKDKRVVPLMTERMVEALQIEDKVHEVHWYDDEAHGWERRDNRRDAFGRILGFLRSHVPPDQADPAGSSPTPARRRRSGERSR